MSNQILKAILLFLLPVAVFAAPGTYVTGEVGGVMLTDGNNHVFDTSENPTGVIGRLSIGHLWGDNIVNYGVELGGSYFPNATISDSKLNDADLTYKGYAVDLLGVVKYNFASKVFLLAKGGAAYLHQQVDLSIPYFGSFSFSGSKIAPELALGVGYQATPKVGLSLVASSIFAGELTERNPVAAQQALMFGLTYNID